MVGTETAEYSSGLEDIISRMCHGDLTCNGLTIGPSASASEMAGALHLIVGNYLVDEVVYHEEQWIQRRKQARERPCERRVEVGIEQFKQSCRREQTCWNV